MQRDLGWTFFEQLAKQNVMQVQSSADPPKKLELGERAVQADGNEYNILQLRDAGRPVEPVYATEGSPMIVGPTASSRARRTPTQHGCSSRSALPREAQQLAIDVGGLRSLHPQAREKPNWIPLKDIKTLKDDPAAVEQQGSSIKTPPTPASSASDLHHGVAFMTSELPQIAVAETLARRIAALKPGVLPEQTRRKCEDLLIDVVGLCVTARNEDYVKAALDGCDDDGPCSVIGHARTLTASGSAFVNGTSGAWRGF